MTLKNIELEWTIAEPGIR